MDQGVVVGHARALLHVVRNNANGEVLLQPQNRSIARAICSSSAAIRSQTNVTIQRRARDNPVTKPQSQFLTPSAPQQDTPYLTTNLELLPRTRPPGLCRNLCRHLCRSLRPKTPQFDRVFALSHRHTGSAGVLAGVSEHLVRRWHALCRTSSQALAGFAPIKLYGRCGLSEQPTSTRLGAPTGQPKVQLHYGREERKYRAYRGSSHRKTPRRLQTQNPPRRSPAGYQPIRSRPHPRPHRRVARR